MRPPHRLSSVSVVFAARVKPQFIPRHPTFRYRMASTTPFGLKESSLIRQQAFIDGKWVDANEGAVIKVTNPATTEELGTVPEMGLAETKQAIDAASKAFKTWSKTTAKWFALMREHSDDLARLITLENGKPFAEAKSSSPPQWFAEEAVRTYGEVVPSAIPNIRNVVVKQPIGA
uniref:Succinate-semialdehyde dehydrogenase (EC) n=1 Tax=Ganoderma boninense TaxID=34458 RepID=A0A5K1JRP2_9APHY|nr:Succinate-semialdehyde dehydrogenase (EC [Ganoderma boninense]